VNQCAPTKFSWTGGTAPYYILYDLILCRIVRILILFNSFNSTASVISKKEEDSAGNSAGNITIVTGLGFGNIYDTSFTTSIYFQKCESSS